MNKRQAKKKRKKQIDDGLNAAIICTRRVGEFLSKWVAEGMPFPDKESEEQNDEIEKTSNKNLCNSCTTKECIFQSGIVRKHCDFYKAESEDKE